MFTWPTVRGLLSYSFTRSQDKTYEATNARGTHVSDIYDAPKIAVRFNVIRMLTIRHAHKLLEPSGIPADHRGPIQALDGHKKSYGLCEAKGDEWLMKLGSDPDNWHEPVTNTDCRCGFRNERIVLPSRALSRKLLDV